MLVNSAYCEFGSVNSGHLASEFGLKISNKSAQVQPRSGGTCLESEPTSFSSLFRLCTTIVHTTLFMSMQNIYIITHLKRFCGNGICANRLSFHTNSTSWRHVPTCHGSCVHPSSIDAKLLLSLCVPGLCSEAEMSSIETKLLLSLCVLGPCSEAEMSSIDTKLLLSLCVSGSCSEAEMSSINAKLLLSLCGMWYKTLQWGWNEFHRCEVVTFTLCSRTL